MVVVGGHNGKEKADVGKTGRDGVKARSRRAAGLLGHVAEVRGRPGLHGHARESARHPVGAHLRLVCRSIAEPNNILDTARSERRPRSRPAPRQVESRPADIGYVVLICSCL